MGYNRRVPQNRATRRRQGKGSRGRPASQQRSDKTLLLVLGLFLLLLIAVLALGIYGLR